MPGADEDDRPGRLAVWVEGRVVDRLVHPDRLAARRERAQHVAKLLDAQPARQAVVHGGVHRVVDDVGVEMHPVPVDASTQDMPHGSLGCFAHAQLAHFAAMASHRAMVPARS